MLYKLLFTACLLVASIPTNAWSQDAAPLTYDVPKGWRVVEPTAFAVATLEVGEGEQPAKLSITPLAGDGGGLPANINRWRAQLGLEAVAEDEALKAARPIKIDGLPGHTLELIGPEAAGNSAKRILAAMVKRDDATWYFKMLGPSKTVVDQKAAFDGFIKSVKFAK